LFDLFQFVADCRDAIVADKSHKYVREGSIPLCRRAHRRILAAADSSFDVVMCQFGMNVRPAALQGADKCSQIRTAGAKRT
jgi:hypothetical protein